MALKLDAPYEEKFFLNLPEEEGVAETDLTFVVIRQASQHQHERRASLAKQTSTVYKKDSEEAEYKQYYSAEEQKRLEAYLTLTECNIEAEASTPEKPEYLFKFRTSGKNAGLAMSEQEFAEAWGKLPMHWAAAIHDKVLEVNKDWSPNFKG